MAFQFIFEKVNFIGESSIDSGGPRREFFAYESLIVHERWQGQVYGIKCGSFAGNTDYSQYLTLHTCILVQKF